MFQDLDDILKRLLAKVPPAGGEAPPPAVGDAAVNFLTPDSSFGAAIQGTTLNLFLHRIQENRELREPTDFAVTGDDATVRRRPLLRVDCSYLVTAWASGNGDAKVSAEHKALGTALQWLSRFPTIPKIYLPNPPLLPANSLANPDFPLPYTMSASLDQTRIPVDFWTALGIAPRPSFDLIVTIAIDLGKQPIDGPAVTDRDLIVGAKKGDTMGVIFSEIHDVGGFVVDGTNTPIKGASVILTSPDNSQHTTTTVADGSYQFNGLASAAYGLRASAPSLPTRDKFIRVPRNPSNADPDFNLKLS